MAINIRGNVPAKGLLIVSRSRLAFVVVVEFDMSVRFVCVT